MNKMFYQPKTLREALKNKRDMNHAHILAGGTDFVIAMQKYKISKENIIDLSKVMELKNIKILYNEIKIGSMVTFTSLVNSEILHSKAPFLSKSALSVGATQIRNKGTIGGNICNSSPAADGVTPLLALDSHVVLQSMDTQGDIRSRTLHIKDFIVDNRQTLLKESEILTEIIFKVPTENTRMDFDKIARRNVLAISRLNGSCLMEITNGRVEQIKLVLGAATSKPERIRVVEEYLTGKELNSYVLNEAGSLASNYVLEQTGMRSSSTYKLPAVARFTVSLIESTLRKEDKIHE